MSVEIIQDLLKWGESNGISLPSNIEFKHDPVRGIYCSAKVDIDNVETPISLRLPNDLIIRGSLSYSMFGMKGNSWLKLFLARLMFEEHPADQKVAELQIKFKPYLDALPQVVDSPLVWNPRELLLLGGTNLGNSIHDKSGSIFNEWVDLINNKTASIPEYKMNAIEEQMATKFDYPIYKEYYDGLLKQTVERKPTHWLSFSAFLWSHLIFTSRAFPEYIIDNKCDESSIILLPIIDLLNHQNVTKVKWSSDVDGSFSYKCLENFIPAGSEILNNYGAKSNEELLYGYGFTLNPNDFDSVILKIKLGSFEIENILKNEPEVKLPLIEDYTTFAFDSLKNKKKEKLEMTNRTADDYKDGVIFLLSSGGIHESLELLVQLFGCLVQHGENERYSDLRPRLHGIQSLRGALNMKLEGLPSVAKKIPSDFSEYEVKEYRMICANNYIENQRNILKSSLSELKKMEKVLMSENKASFLTVAKILKYDLNFAQDEISKPFADYEIEREIVFESNFDILVLWLLCKIKHSSFPKKYTWVKEVYDTFTKIIVDEEDSEILEFYDHLFLPEDYNDGDRPFTFLEVNAAFQIVDTYSYTRPSGSGAAPDTILVNPL